LHIFLLLLCLGISGTTASASNSTHPKRGLIYIETSHPSDDEIFTLPNTPLTWYYNYGPYPTSPLTSWTTNFVPMVHGATDALTDVETIQSLLNSSSSFSSSSQGNTITHLLTFNEPDGTTASGGTSTSPHDAAEAYISDILPLRSAPYNLLLSLPATTGSPTGLQWLRDFNTSCFQLNPRSGCAFDFVATHWYGDFAGLAAWMAQIHDLYPGKDVWVTEFAIPGVDADASLAFLNQSLQFLDASSYVGRYSWFGTFREDDADEWTGGGVSLLDDKGRLTELGAVYLGGEADGFEEGQASGAPGVASGRSMGLLVVSFLAAVMVCISIW